MKKVSVAEAKAHFSECVEQAENGSPVVITRHGKPVAGLISANDLKHVQKIQSAGPEAGLAGLAGGWKDSEDLVEVLQGLKRSHPRRVRVFD